MTEKVPKAPAGLSVRSRKLWRDVVSGWEMDAPGLELLRLACQALDRSDEAQAVLERDGVVVEGRYGVRAHPAVGIRRDAAVEAARHLRELALSPEEVADPRLPRNLRGVR